MTYHFEYISEELKGMIEPATKLSHFFEGPLSFRVVKNAYIAPFHSWAGSIGCVIDEKGATVSDSGCIEWKEDAGLYDLSTARREHKRVIFLGFLLTVFGHSYTDDLRKLWFLKIDEFKSMTDSGVEAVYTTNRNHPLPEPVLEVIRLADVDLKPFRHITLLTQFDEVIIPDNCLRAMDFGRIYSKEYIDLTCSIKGKIPEWGDGPSKVFFTRTKIRANSKKDFGEKSIERFFKKQGYTIIAPEQYPVLRQLQIIRGCDCFASTEGSVAHLSLFARPNTQVTIINKANYLNFHQVMINELANLDVTYVEAHHSSKANPQVPWWGPFYLCVNRYLERYAHHPVLHLPYWMHFSYWKYSRNILFKVYNRTRKTIRGLVH